MALSALVLLSAAASARAAVQTFGPGTLIIPMDTSADGQDNGMLRAYGLVYALLREGVPVSWAINPAKPVNGNDFAAPFVGMLQDVRTGATVTSPRLYRGGPFLVSPADAATALPIIQAWQAVAGDQTAVHRVVGANSITPDISRLLIGAPRIAVLKDGNETIAYEDLNAAGLTDSVGGVWSSASPDQLTETDVEGPTTTTDDDGALFEQLGASRVPRYCFLFSMHYVTTSHTDEVAQEVRQWLDRSSLLHAFMQCAATRVFENAIGGLYLTTTGLADDGGAPVTSAIRAPWDPLVQIDGTLDADAGSVATVTTNAGGAFKTGVATLINEASQPSLGRRVVMLSGRLDGDAANGTVTYLGGHDYALDLPVSTHPQTNGVRLFLDSILASDCATAAQTKLTLVKTAPALINTSQINYTIAYGNPAAATAVAENVKLVDKLPAGATYVNGSALLNGIAFPPTSTSGGQVTWNLPSLLPGASSTVTFSATVSADGAYTNNAKLYYSVLTAGVVTASAITTRDTVPPTVSITSGPTGTIYTTSASFDFTASGDTASTQCHVDADPYTSCSASFTANGLAVGAHTFTVRASDAAGNFATESRAFTVARPIGDRVWRDSDGDGVQDGGESGIDGVTVQLLDGGNNLLATTTTSGGGFYGFDGAGAGSYKVRVVAGSLPAFYVGTYDLDGTATPNIAGFTLAAGSGHSDIDFGYRVVPPVVSSVDSVRDADDGLGDGEITAVPLTQLYLAFSRAIDEFSATSPASYRLVTAGADHLLQTTSCSGLAGDDAGIAIENALWDAPSRQARLILEEPRALASGSYRLLACATLVGDDGTALDGDGDGQPGGAFRRDFDVTETDLLANPNFDSSLAHWSVSEPHAGDTQGDPEDAESKPTSGSATVMTAGVAGDYVLSQCADFTSAGQVRGEAALRSQSALAGVPHATVTIDFFPISGCSGAPIAPATISTSNDGDTAGAFLRLIAGPMTVPPAAHSARLSLRLHGNAGEAYTSTWDSAFLGTTKTLFASSFEVDLALEWGGKTP